MKILVSYFSASGVTKNVATKLAKLLNGDLEEIKPVSEYTKDDLNWNNKNSRSSLEMENENARPEIIKPLHNLDDYDFVFIGYPIWWYVEPRVIDTYLDNFKSCKTTIIPFATSGGSNIKGSVNHLRNLYKNLNIKDGLLLNNGINEELIKNIINNK